MLNLNAFGPELNVVHPPRPQDPKLTWNQAYAVKLRQRSCTGSVGGMAEGMAHGGRDGRDAAQAEAPTEAGKPSVADQAKSLLTGICGK